jgi:hypothetical protein
MLERIRNAARVLRHTDTRNQLRTGPKKAY